MSHLEEHTLDENFGRTCEVCGARLTEQEIHDAREFGRPFLCSAHAAEDVPAEDLAHEEGLADGEAES
jgi:hypothetical protein